MFVTNPDEVRLQLRRRVLAGYSPQWTWASSCDHACDFQAITKKEFEEIVALAMAQRSALQPVA